MAYIGNTLLESAEEKTSIWLQEFQKVPRLPYWRVKRTFDLLCAMVALLVMFPLLVLIAGVIFLDDPHGSPLFAQTRVGRHGKTFTMIKFRTMTVGAERMRVELSDQNEMDGPVFKIRNDPRVTRVGRFLRASGLDELPQFLNVLEGSMSLVGPRPPLPNEVAQYNDYQRLRLLVTPGLTCTWQISPRRNDMSFSDWVEMDLDYIMRSCMRLDLDIILKTPGAMLHRDGC